MVFDPVQAYVDKYIRRKHSVINRICEPLEKVYGINYFTYHSITEDGLWRPIVSRVDWADFYTESQFYRIDPFLLNLKCYQSGVVTWDLCHMELGLSAILKKAWDKFDFMGNVMIVEKSETRCEFFGFTAPKFSLGPSLFLTGLPALRQFARYFKAELKPLLEAVEDDPIHIREIRGAGFDSTVQSPFHAAFDKNLEFLKSINVVPKTSLSRREKECLKIYFHLQKVSDVAEIMRLSPRTVESYLESIKNKLVCLDKTDLLRQARDLLDLGLI